jgi:hypothetical protein
MPERSRGFENPLPGLKSGAYTTDWHGCLPNGKQASIRAGIRFRFRVGSSVVIAYEFISLFVGATDTPSCGADQWRIETEPPAGSSRFGFFHGALDRRKNELSRGAAPSGSGLMDPAVKLAGEVDRGTDSVGLHDA